MLSDVINRIDFVKAEFLKRFGYQCDNVFSAPGRSELGGNHTDHQQGHVLACAIDLDILAVACSNGTSKVRFHSEGYSPITVDLTDLYPKVDEEQTSAALIRGAAARMHELGALESIAGFDAYAISDVPKGGGLSSSAAFEVLVGTIFNELFCNGLFTSLEIAQIGRYAENVYFGKPCGLMDQAACSIGGVVAIDFADLDHPKVEKIEIDFEEYGYAFCIIDSHANHSDLTSEYASVAEDMEQVATLLGANVLSEIPEERFIAAIPFIREKVDDRAILRAMHFYADDKRAVEEAAALKAGDFNKFLYLVRQSGRSSAMYLQNIYPTGQVKDQSLMLTLALAEKLLDGEGAVRVHGGGFGGCAQAYVPLGKLDAFKKEIDELLGSGSCHVLDVRNVGGIWLRQDDAA